MLGKFKALILDMDGVLIDSEPLWRKAMIKGFGEIGIPFTEEDCRKTTGMRFKEVVEFWLKERNKADIKVEDVETGVLRNLVKMIETEGKAVEGVLDVLKFAEENGLKTGLATSSYSVLVDAVLKKLELKDRFHAVVSAEKMKYGKPHPEVFLQCAANLNTEPSACIVIEDSINGVIAGKAAQMLVITVPDIDHKFNKQFAVANHQCEHMAEVLRLFKEIKSSTLAE